MRLLEVFFTDKVQKEWREGAGPKDRKAVGSELFFIFLYGLKRHVNVSYLFVLDPFCIG